MKLKRPQQIIRNHSIVLLLSSLLSMNSFAQISISANYNRYSDCCMAIMIKNNSRDTVYTILQSNYIYPWDSCFAYTVNPKEFSQSHEMNISYYSYDMGALNNNRILYIYPDSILTFGARSNNLITKDSLFLKMYVNATYIGDTKKIEKLKGSEFARNKRKKYVPGWGWKSIYVKQNN